MANSPTSRTLAYLRKLGWRAQVVERFNRFAKVRVDLFGFIDICCLGKSQKGVMAVQACAGASHAARRTKILGLQDARLWLECGNSIYVISWAKQGARGERKTWTARIEKIVLEDFK